MPSCFPLSSFDCLGSPLWHHLYFPNMARLLNAVFPLVKSASLSIPGNITKKLPRRTVVPISDTVIFCVELEHPCPDAYWTRNGERLKEDSRVSIACVLRQYTLTIRDCQADDSGEVAFVAGDCKTSTRFSVTGED